MSIDRLEPNVRECSLLYALQCRILFVGRMDSIQESQELVVEFIDDNQAFATPSTR